MSDYTPTTEEVRDNYTYGASACGCCAEYRDEDYKKFDLWLAAELRKAKAEAFDQGVLAGRSREHHANMTDEQAETAFPNPYRADEMEGEDGSN